MTRQRIIIAVVGTLVLIAGLAYVLWPKPAPVDEVSQTPNPVVSTESSDFSDMYLKNIETLTTTFSSQEYMFINDNTLDYARKAFSRGDHYELDAVSFEQLSSTSWQFMVRGSNGDRLFYVIVTRAPGNQLSLGFYNI